MPKKYDFSVLRKSNSIRYSFFDPNDEIDARFVRNLRDKLDMTQYVFASVLGVSKKTVEKWEQGANPIIGPTAKFLYLINEDPGLLNVFYQKSSQNAPIREPVTLLITPQDFLIEVIENEQKLTALLEKIRNTEQPGSVPASPWHTEPFEKTYCTKETGHSDNACLAGA